METELFQSVNNRYLLIITDEPKQLLQPISGYASEPLLSLDDACEPLLNIVPNLPAHIWIAKENCQNPCDSLTQDESASIHLYIMEWDPTKYEKRESLYSHLNFTLKQSNRGQLRPWFCYLKLFLTALAKLPIESRQTVWRGVRKYFSEEFVKGTKVTSSCTRSLNILESDLYLGNTGVRTLFSIETFNARSIRAHSYFKAEDEILLLPGTYLEVRESLHIEESRAQYESLLKNKKKLLVGLGLGFLIIAIGIILAVVLSTQLRRKYSSTLYWASGPQMNLDPTLLIGWEQCYNQSYTYFLHGATLTALLSQCNKSNLLLACQSINDTNLAVAAMSAHSDVTYPCQVLTDFYIANDVSWYFDTNSSWGFAKAGDNVNRTPCDTVFDQDDDLRLCWHTMGYNGFRCGGIYFDWDGPYNPNQWFRVVYHAD